MQMWNEKQIKSQKLLPWILYLSVFNSIDLAQWICWNKHTKHSFTTKMRYTLLWWFIFFCMYSFDMQVHYLKAMKILQLFYIQSTVYTLYSSCCLPHLLTSPHLLLFCFSSKSFPLISISFSMCIYFSNVIIIIVPHLSVDFCFWVCQEFIIWCMRGCIWYQDTLCFCL